MIEPPSDAEDSVAFDQWAMRQALTMAREAMSIGEVPVGAVVVRSRRIVSQAYNLRETTCDPTAHAERIALTLAGSRLGTWRLDGCTLYVTLEPCPMCAGAIVQSRVDRLVFGTPDPKAGACESLYRLVSDPRFNHRAAITAGCLQSECSELLSEFFRGRRPQKPVANEATVIPWRGA
jgi:tRNA(adenine34) deaminase